MAYYLPYTVDTLDNVNAAGKVFFANINGKKQVGISIHHKVDQVAFVILGTTSEPNFRLRTHLNSRCLLVDAPVSFVPRVESLSLDSRDHYFKGYIHLSKQLCLFAEQGDDLNSSYFAVDLGSFEVKTLNSMGSGALFGQWDLVMEDKYANPEGRRIIFSYLDPFRPHPADVSGGPGAGEYDVEEY